ncbi:arsenical resistance protein ArsH [Albimonas donghaensis]|uniref:Arsenical resistance protein ArsH n=1 Tax=Albimonas donghaensis TaxID=356660 RepID=A0A1H3ABJ2_9RHOB|nr:arsenical resistance protein ArsH [Albimonas donghaensis]SDX26935.1 arsenical resistance protein ArsH [Albimonas donghaensis]
MIDGLPHIDPEQLRPIDPTLYAAPDDPGHRPRLLILHGSVRARSFSRGVGDEAERLLTWFGAEVRRFDPSGLPLPDDADPSHPRVRELRDLAIWSEGMLWVSPERHGAMTGIMKAQIDWIPLATGGVRPTQGKTLGLAQVSGGSQSFNAVNQMRILGRWMRMVTIPNQSSVPRAWDEFDDDLRMRASPLYLRLVDVCEELMKFTWMTRARSAALTDRYSERVESAEKTSQRVNQSRL